VSDDAPHEHRIPEGEEPRWIDHPENVQKLVRALFIVTALLMLSDFGYHKHGHYGFEDFPGFHAFYGFGSFVFLVLVATQLRKVVMRDEDYYGD
jgi:hypothetical protein